MQDSRSFSFQTPCLTRESSNSGNNCTTSSSNPAKKQSDNTSRQRSPEICLTGGHVCQCTATALSILEKLPIPSKASDLGAAEQTLYLLKRSIRQCYSLTQCHACWHESGFNILMIMLYEKMTGIFERLVVEKTHHIKIFTGTPSNNPNSGARQFLQNNESDPKQGRMLIGEYEIDTFQEHCDVFDTLFVFQLNKLGDLLSEIKRNALGANWESHLAALRPVTQRMKNLKGPFENETR